jgi:hypothetical protein
MRVPRRFGSRGVFPRKAPRHWRTKRFAKVGRHASRALPSSGRISDFEFRISPQRRPDPVHIVMIVERLQELTDFSTLEFAELRVILWQVSKFTGDNFPSVLG